MANPGIWWEKNIFMDGIIENELKDFLVLVMGGCKILCNVKTTGRLRMRVSSRWLKCITIFR